MVYKWCVVPQCTNTSTKSPNKLFVSVPTNPKRRKMWLLLARRFPDSILMNSNVFMCEDHFDMEKDTKNYMQYKMGFTRKILLADEAVPTKFHCQEDHESRLSDAGSSPEVFLKRQSTQLVAECPQSQSGTETHAESSQEVFLKRQRTQLVAECLKSGTKNTESLQKDDKTEKVIEPEDDDVASPGEDMGDGDDDDVLSLYSDSTKSSISETSKPSDGQILTENTCLHTGYTCNSCYGEIRGFRYTCVQCLDYDLCSTCEAKGIHCLHYVLRIPKPAPFSEIELVLNKVRAQLSHGANVQTNKQTATGNEQPPVLDIKVEVKEEPDPLFEDGMEEVNTFIDNIDTRYTAPKDDTTQPSSILNVATVTTETVNGNTFLVIENPVSTGSVASSDKNTKRKHEIPIHVPPESTEKRMKFEPQPQVSIMRTSFINVPITGYVSVPSGAVGTSYVSGEMSHKESVAQNNVGETPLLILPHIKKKKETSAKSQRKGKPLILSKSKKKSDTKNK